MMASTTEAITSSMMVKPDSLFAQRTAGRHLIRRILLSSRRVDLCAHFPRSRPPRIPNYGDSEPDIPLVRMGAAMIRRALILAIDQGTTGTTCLLVDDDLAVHGRGYAELPQHFPRPGWVEHDPGEIWQSVLAAAEQALVDTPTAIGITNQRETAVVWDRRTGE